MACKVGRQDKGRRESSAKKGINLGLPERWLPTLSTLFFPSPPWLTEEEGAELQYQELHQPDGCELFNGDADAPTPCHP